MKCDLIVSKYMIDNNIYVDIARYIKLSRNSQKKVNFMAKIKGEFYG
jgi:hypothetical protein